MYRRRIGYLFKKSAGFSEPGLGEIFVSVLENKTHIDVTAGTFKTLIALKCPQQVFQGPICSMMRSALFCKINSCGVWGGTPENDPVAYVGVNVCVVN